MNHLLRGNAWKYGDNVDTDVIIPDGSGYASLCAGAHGLFLRPGGGVAGSLGAACKPDSDLCADGGAAGAGGAAEGRSA